LWGWVISGCNDQCPSSVDYTGCSSHCPRQVDGAVSIQDVMTSVLVRLMGMGHLHRIQQSDFHRIQQSDFHRMQQGCGVGSFHDVMTNVLVRLMGLGHTGCSSLTYTGCSSQCPRQLCGAGHSYCPSPR
jgi:hypothetical protein